MFLLHRVIHPALPTWLRLRHLVARPYRKLLLSYQRDYLQKWRRYPHGLAYHLVGVEEVAPHSYGYRLHAPPGIDHQCGDTLLINWCNSDEEVTRVIAAGRWSAGDAVRLQTASSVFAPGARLDTDLYSALRDHVEIHRVAHRLLALPKTAPSTPATLAELLASLEADSPSQEQVLAVQPRIKPRSYTISDVQTSPDGDTIEIIVSTTGQKTGHSSDSELLGRCTGFLSRMRTGDKIRAWPLRYPLVFDGSGAPDRPLLVIATGIAMAAPLCALRTCANQRPLWLVWGERHYTPDQSFLLRLLAFTREFPHCRVDIALSRDHAPAAQSQLPVNCFWHAHSRVQDLFDTAQDRLKDHLQNDGDLIVIGHQSMGAAVRKRLRRGLVEAGQASDAGSAARLLHRLEDNLRVQYSLSGR